MRWTSITGALALFLALTAGCAKQCFTTECDLEHYRDNLSGDLAYDPEAAFKRSTIAYTGAPATVLDPGRYTRFISLAESISIAMEQGTTGPNFLNFGVNDGNAGVGNDNLGVAVSDAIRAFALDPAITGAAIERALSKFDALYLASMQWSAQDIPIGTALQAFQAGQGGINAIETEAASFSSSIVKPLPTGGVAGITFATDYQLTNLPARVNPSYTPRLVFNFEQPLLQNFGVDINQLNASHPGSILFPNAPINRGQGQEGILITRIRFDQSRANFEAQLNRMVANVEAAYWRLYARYWELYAREAALRLSFKILRNSEARFREGGDNLAQLAQVRGQYNLFRSQRLTALGQVLEAERNLRKLLGMTTEDGTRLVPLDKPTLAPYRPEWHTSLEEALAHRPELVEAREELKIAQLNIRQQLNFLRPDLRFTSTYDINAIGSQLDGTAPNNALRNLADNRFNSYSLGLQLSVPLGYRDAHANVRIARLSLARAHAVLKDQELKTQQYLTLRYRRLLEFYEQIKISRAQREAYGEQLRALSQRVGQDRNVDVLLEAQRFWADALVSEFNNIATYNAELAGFEFAKGTILRHNNIVIADGELPHCALERASAHFEERSKALVLREREAPVQHQKLQCGEHSLSLPNIPHGEAVTLPALLNGAEKPIDGRGVLATPGLIHEDSEPVTEPTSPATLPEVTETPTAPATLPEVTETPTTPETLPEMTNLPEPPPMPKSPYSADSVTPMAPGQ